MHWPFSHSSLLISFPISHTIPGPERNREIVLQKWMCILGTGTQRNHVCIVYTVHKPKCTRKSWNINEWPPCLPRCCSHSPRHRPPASLQQISYPPPRSGRTPTHSLRLESTLVFHLVGRIILILCWYFLADPFYTGLSLAIWAQNSLRHGTNLQNCPKGW